jgi:hypothetical protein
VGMGVRAMANKNRDCLLALRTSGGRAWCIGEFSSSSTHLNNLSVQMLNTIELLVEQHQGLHQL